MYEIFVETIFAFLSVACWVIPTGMKVSNSNKVIMLSFNHHIQGNHPVFVQIISEMVVTYSTLVDSDKPTLQ